MNRREAIQRAALLLGGAFSAPNLTALLNFSPGGDGASLPGVLTADQKELLGVLADHIIPPTDTPGAREVGVADFIDRLLTESYEADTRDHFLSGLAQVDALSEGAYGRAFLALEPAEQVNVLGYMDQQAFQDGWILTEVPWDSSLRDKFEGLGGDPLERPVDPDSPSSTERSRPPFFRSMKELTLVGYYTSEVGATQELRHEPLPGRYDGCVPYEEIGKTWAV